MIPQVTIIQHQQFAFMAYHLVSRMFSFNIFLLALNYFEAISRHTILSLMISASFLQYKGSYYVEIKYSQYQYHIGNNNLLALSNI